MYNINKNTKHGSSSWVVYISYTLPEKSAKHVLFFISGGIFDQISIALYFIILTPELERAFERRMYIFYYSGVLSNLRFPWKTELPWNFSSPNTNPKEKKVGGRGIL